VSGDVCLESFVWRLLSGDFVLKALCRDVVPEIAVWRLLSGDVCPEIVIQRCVPGACFSEVMSEILV